MRYQFSHWLAGYSKFLVTKYGSDNERGEDDASLAKLNVIGNSVGIACVMVPINWAVGSSHWTIGQSETTRIAVSTFAAVFGLAVVLTIDRSAVFAMDVNRKGSGVWQYIVLRILMVLAVGLFTSEQIIPFIMRSSLLEQSTQVGTVLRTQDVDRNRKESNIAERLSIYKDAKDKESEARGRWSTINSTLAASKSALYICKARRRTNYQSCTVERNSVAGAESNERQASIDLREAENKRKDANTKWIAATDLYDQLVRKTSARNDTADNIRALSSTELYKLVSSDDGAAIEFGIIMFILVMIELMPIITKGMIGRTNIGYSIYTDNLVWLSAISLREMEVESKAKKAEITSRIYIDVFQLERLRQNVIDNMSKEVFPHIQTELLSRSYNEMIHKLKGTITTEMNDKTDYKEGGFLTSKLFSEMLNRILRYWGLTERI